MKQPRRKKQLTRQEHIISSSYLQNFCDPEGLLFVYERGRDVRQSRPDKECKERDFYEYEFRGRKTENACENWLGNIENEAKAVLPLVLNSQQLNQSQILVWASFVASLFARTRKVRAQFSSAMIQRFRKETERPEFVRDLQYQLLQTGELQYATELQKQIDELRTAMDNEPAFYHVTGLPRKTAIIADAVMCKRWHTVSAPPGKFFVTSDSPVVTVARKGNEWSEGTGFGNENAMILLPLNPQKMFCAIPAFMNVNPAIGDRFVDSTNYVVVRFAHRNVYAHMRSEQIKTLVDGEINKVIFGQNAFLPRLIFRYHNDFGASNLEPLCRLYLLFLTSRMRKLTGPLADFGSGTGREAATTIR